MTSTAVSVTGLTKRYGHRTVVDHLDIELPSGVVAGFVPAPLPHVACHIHRAESTSRPRVGCSSTSSFACCRIIPIG